MPTARDSLNWMQESAASLARLLVIKYWEILFSAPRLPRAREACRKCRVPSASRARARTGPETLGSQTLLRVLSE
jgi:hypothetical protein